jgi:hypothetical protein
LGVGDKIVDVVIPLLKLLAAETTQEPAHTLTVRRHNPRPNEPPVSAAIL